MKKYFNFFNKKAIDQNKIKDKNHENIDKSSVPKHIAIIMDGNGRWAKKRNLPRKIGHKAGVEAIRPVVKECDKLGVKYLTIYAFSTENWKRPKSEINALMKLLVEYLKNEFDELNKNNVIINSIGDITELPMICQQELKNAYRKTKGNTGLMLNLALNYGGRNEIVTGVKSIYKQIANGKLRLEEVDEKIISDNIYTYNIPDPDLIIRTSGEQRLSNFLLWQSAYSELYFTDTLWPDFDENNLREALIDYQNRNRRFGGV